MKEERIQVRIDAELKKKVNEVGWQVKYESHSPNTPSKYVYIVSEKGFMFEVRISNHLRPGFKRMTNNKHHINITSKYAYDAAMKYMLKNEKKGKYVGKHEQEYGAMEAQY